MYEIGIVAQFEAAHRLKGDFGPATRTHGHTYRVEVAVRGPGLKADSTLSDISVLQGAVQDVTSTLHYRDLDELPAFIGRITTAEVVARHIFDEVSPRFHGEGLTWMAVRVWESPSAYALYEDALT